MHSTQELATIAQGIRDATATGKPFKFPIMKVKQLEALSELLRNMEQ